METKSYFKLLILVLVVLALALVLNWQGVLTKKKSSPAESETKSETPFKMEKLQPDKLPADYPAEFAVSESAFDVEHYRVENQRNKSFAITLVYNTNDTLKTAAVYYEKLLTDNSWAPKKVVDNAQSQIFEGKKSGHNVIATLNRLRSEE